MSLRHVLLAALLAISTIGAQAADIVIINNDGAGEGFNDDTPRQPTGGNPGDTVGAQRLFAFNFAADLLGEKLISTVTIEVNASFDPLDCSPNSATLGQAGTEAIIDFEDDPPPGAQANTLYAIALGNALAGRDLDVGEADIVAQFNSSIDNNALCLTGTNWYYGVDNNPPDGDIDFLSTVVHEIIHGLGFASFANVSTGAFPGGTPDIYSRFIRDLTQNATWDDISAPQRAASATNDGNVVFEGPSIVSQGAPTLAAGTNQGFVQLYAPVVVQPGSSISHWDTRLDPNALMEPFDTGDTDFDNNGIGLSTCALQDLGWVLTSGTNCPSDGNDTVGGGTGGGSGGGGGSSDSTPAPNGGGGGGGSGAWPLASLVVLLLCATLLRRTQTRREAQ